MKSENKVNNFKSAFKYFFMKNLPIIVGMSVIAVVGVLFYLAMTVDTVASPYLGEDMMNTIAKSNIFQSLFPSYGMVSEDVRLIIQVGSLALIAFMALLIAREFNYLFNKQKLDLFHAFPIKRNELLMSKTAVIFLTVTIQYIVGLLALGAFYLIKMKGITEIDWLLTLGCAFKYWTVCIAFCAIFIFCAVSAGRYLQYLITAALISVMGIGFNFLVEMPGAFVSGYAENTKILQYISPLNVLISNDKSSNYGVAAAMLVIALLFVFLSVKAYKGKKSEDAQSTISYRLAITMSIFSASMIAMFVCAKIVLLGATISPYVVVLIACLLSAVVTVLCELVLNKCANIKAAMFQFAVFAVASLIAYTVSITGLCGYAAIPSVDKVESVSWTVDGYNDSFEPFFPLDFFADRKADVTLESRESIEKVIEFHEKANELFNDKKSYDSGKIRVVYTMKDKTEKVRYISRSSYKRKVTNNITGDALQKNYKAVEATTEFQLDKFRLFGETDGSDDFEAIMKKGLSDNILAIEFNFESVDNSVAKDGIIIDRDVIKEVYSALYSDIIGGEESVFSNDYGYYYNNAAMTAKDQIVLSNAIRVSIICLSDEVPEQDRQELMSDKKLMLEILNAFRKNAFNSDNAFFTQSLSATENSQLNNIIVNSIDSGLVQPSFS